MSELEEFGLGCGVDGLLFAVALIIFHIGEFALVIWYHPDKLDPQSWLCSRAYFAAMALATIEHGVECALVPGMKGFPLVFYTGLFLVVVGEGVRKVAMSQAGESFTHLIADQHVEHHKLVTQGLYRVARHPGYAGFFWWAVGTQVLLGNPLSVIVFAVVVFKFFANRIPYEERTLVRFFGSEYTDYRARTRTWIPFIP